jgi:acyl-CoA thioesterase-1
MQGLSGTDRSEPTGYGPSARLFNAFARPLLRYLGAVLLALTVGTGMARAAPVTVLAFGDSLTAGYGVAPEEAYPAKLEAALKAKGYNVRIVNAGVSGDTTAGGLARLDWALGDRPAYALVELGANDALRGLEPADTAANLDKILQGLEQAKVKVLLMGMLAPNNWGADYAQRFDRIFPDLAARHHVPLYPFFLDGVALDPKLNQPDMLHPNPTGVDVIVQRTLPAVEQLLGPPGMAPS